MGTETFWIGLYDVTHELRVDTVEGTWISDMAELSCQPETVYAQTVYNQIRE